MIRQPQYQQTTVALEKLLADSPPGSILPSEPALADQLGVSRATLREAMRTFEDRGWIIRRRGIGTYVNSPPIILDYGLEVLESIDALAERTGLSVEMQGLQRRTHLPTPIEAKTFAIPSEVLLCEISRVILLEGQPAAYLIDVLPANEVPTQVEAADFGGSVLDLLLEQRDLGCSKTEISSVPAPPAIASHLQVEERAALLRLEALLYTTEWQPIDHSFSYFLPGTFRFHVVRKVGPANRAGG